MRTCLISAVCTPLSDDGSLDVDGLAAHLEEQWRHGIAGVLIGGTMGIMQLLPDPTYRDLVRHGTQLAHGQGEVLVGAGDTSFTRTLERVRYVEQFDVDGIVVLSPFFITLGQAELIDYFRQLADLSGKPIYLYDLPGTTKTRLALETVLELSKHPNIHGIKCSGEWSETWRLMSRVDSGFRVVPAQPHMVDLLTRCGVAYNLDGVFAIVPDLTASIVEAAEQGDHALAGLRQCKLSELLHLIVNKYPLFPACSALLNAKRISGNVFVPRSQPLSPEQREQFLDEPVVREILAASAEPAG
ncbi:MAG: dihydrodipicolinate synthase family protein [Thermoguttaceae bacterium]|jgi:4-hydroxy-tetrahydrodipicolinate synthase|nr:dihydrodipicolinate synthase family protein [Thermoguttaceae bacterium]